ncbi:MAG TPA: 2-phospho-L-lactate guanylyltransferase [Blastocatellia bacterium]|nr:2-phospho-L-lactate guanylyltransferase [Blastocatellia bacterium]HMV81521.1 2-phospho-L-lactate guanylyltransferase [Blastocatellia bacterium]HMX27748.1 2-phospho-L-lactate guanylyltransferase [Blastocatellia bacterium]HMY72301.1 2-phospho-L-lactate guanylyltransferase [Blastocatellia bacterium]HMZ21550.1 2-phospho-L-lactate guanylyltransferase [Blastocatellia bacterium]
MRYILIPVKDLARAKQRLAGIMPQEARTRLAWKMLERTFAAAAAVRTIDRVAVVTLYEPAIALAEKYGMEVIPETEQISESASVDFGSREACKRGATAVLRLPIDLPLITAEDIETILAYDQPGKPSVVIVPSRDGTGTNAILRRPPDLFPSHFGAGSLAKHLKEAELAGAECKVLHLPRIALDIDEPEDLAELQKWPNSLLSGEESYDRDNQQHE